MRKVIVGTCFVLLASVRGFSAPEPPKLTTVFVEEAKKKELFDLLSYPARVLAKINAPLLSEFEGVVVRINTPLGDTVRRHQRVLTLKNTDPIYKYAPGIVTSPVAGVVSSIDVTEGSRVVKGQKLATITNPSDLKVTIEIAVSDLSAIKAGMKGELRISDGDEPIPVQVKGISPSVDPATGTATCELSVSPKAKETLPPGAIGRVTFKARSHMGVEIPDPAIIYRGSDTYVRVVENGKSKSIPVVIGDTRRGSVEILKGLPEGSKVIVRSSQYVVEGEAVTVSKPGAD